MLKPSLANVVSHWHNTLEGINTSVPEFYDAIEEQVRARNIPNVRIKGVWWRERGVFSDSRLYLEVRRFDTTYHICGAPYGDSFFVSSWLFRQPSRFLTALSQIPFLGWFAFFYNKVIDPPTLFATDSMMMFQGAVHGAVLAVVDDLVTVQGGRPLSEFERKPVLRELSSPGK